MTDWHMATDTLLRPGQASEPVHIKQLLSVVISQMPCHGDWVGCRPTAGE